MYRNLAFTRVKSIPAQRPDTGSHLHAPEPKCIHGAEKLTTVEDGMTEPPLPPLPLEHLTLHPCHCYRPNFTPHLQQLLLLPPSEPVMRETATVS